eukprot:Gb_25920 [translate_table: standard]
MITVFCLLFLPGIFFLTVQVDAAQEIQIISYGSFFILEQDQNAKLFFTSLITGNLENVISEASYQKKQKFQSKLGQNSIVWRRKHYHEEARSQLQEKSQQGRREFPWKAVHPVRRTQMQEALRRKNEGRIFQNGREIPEMDPEGTTEQKVGQVQNLLKTFQEDINEKFALTHDAK